MAAPAPSHRVDFLTHDTGERESAADNRWFGRARA